jgi:hypothetical protein
MVTYFRTLMNAHVSLLFHDSCQSHMWKMREVEGGILKLRPCETQEFSQGHSLLVSRSHRQSRKHQLCQVPVAHTCNPSCSVGRDLRRILVGGQPGQIVCKTYLKNTQHKTGLTG